MILAALLAAVSVAYPRDGQHLPSLSRCFMIGATDGAETNLVIQGHSVPVHRSGAWAALVDLVPGKNVITVGDCTRTLYVANPPQPPKPTPTTPTTPPQKTAQTAQTTQTSKPSKPPQPPKPVYTKLPYAADKAVPPPTGKKPGEITIALDAGHGGESLGTLSPHGLPEKDVNLRLTREVCAALKAKGFRVMMTRTDDSDVPLYDRPKEAHARKADAFVSIHHNAPGHTSDPGRCRYQAVYYWNPLGKKLATAIERRMAENKALPSSGVVHANFVVMRSPEIPSCLIEADFITHPEGESAAWDPSRREIAVAAIANGIADWVAGK